MLGASWKLVVGEAKAEADEKAEAEAEANIELAALEKLRDTLK
jgi:hypothetical protein